MNPLQRAATVRKVSYLLAIVGLFTVSMLWRGVIPVPGARAAAPLRWLNEHSIDSQATRLEVSDVDKNESDPDLSGSAVRLALTGSRGLAVTALWYSAIDKQKRNDFHVFEQRVRAVTKLQPNFVTPWIFQSWNITYNVSVEMQGSGDMYYYIVRGIQLLAEGERRNQRSPDMRFQIAFYYQNKFGVSDTVETLRCLFDLSCIPPSERNPDRYMAGDKVDLDRFRQFCERHPHFVRRLRGDDVANPDRLQREKLRAPTPEDVVRFLRDNYRDLPSRYRKNGSEWTDEVLADAPPDQYFPVLPPKFAEGTAEANPETPTATDAADGVGYFSAFKAARGWYAYSLLLLPPPILDDSGQPIPAPTQRPGEFGYDPFKHRVPRSPMTVLFRQGAPRAQTYAAELEHKEGWFDGAGWTIEGWFPEKVAVGREREWGLNEWARAAAAWRDHGKKTGLQIDDGRLAQLYADGGAYDPLAADPTPDQLTEAAARRRYFGTLTKGFYNSYRHTTNFPFFLASAETEQLPETTAARKVLFVADRARKAGEPDKAIALYKTGLDLWRGVFERRPDFHKLDRSEEEACELELTYQRLLVQHDQRVRDRANELARGMGAVVPFLPPPFLAATESGQYTPPHWPTASREELKWFVVENVAGAPFSSPFVGTTTAKGEPWVRQASREAVRVRQGVARGAKPAEAARPDAPQTSAPQPVPGPGAP
jgi:hypothetical protein